MVDLLCATIVLCCTFWSYRKSYWYNATLGNIIECLNNTMPIGQHHWRLGNLTYIIPNTARGRMSSIGNGDCENSPTQATLTTPSRGGCKMVAGYQDPYHQASTGAPGIFNGFPAIFNGFPLTFLMDFLTFLIDFLTFLMDFLSFLMDFLTF